MRASVLHRFGISSWQCLSILQCGNLTCRIKQCRLVVLWRADSSAGTAGCCLVFALYARWEFLNVPLKAGKAPAKVRESPAPSKPSALRWFHVAGTLPRAQGGRCDSRRCRQDAGGCAGKGPPWKDRPLAGSHCILPTEVPM